MGKPNTAIRLPGKETTSSVPAPDEAFRSVAAVCYGIIRGPPAPTPVRTIMSADGIDVTTLTKRYVKSPHRWRCLNHRGQRGGKRAGLSN